MKNENPSTISSYPSQKLRESLTTTTGEKRRIDHGAKREFHLSKFNQTLVVVVCLFAQIIEGGRGREDVRERESWQVQRRVELLISLVSSKQREGAGGERKHRFFQFPFSFASSLHIHIFQFPFFHFAIFFQRKLLCNIQYCILSYCGRSHKI